MVTEEATSAMGIATQETGRMGKNMDMAMSSGQMEARIPENTFMEVKLEKEDLIGRMVGLMKATL